MRHSNTDKMALKTASNGVHACRLRSRIHERWAIENRHIPVGHPIHLESVEKIENATLSGY